MVTTPVKYPPVSIAMKPRFMTIPEWRELVVAAHSSWIAFVLRWPSFWCMVALFGFEGYLWWGKRAGWTLPLGLREAPPIRVLTVVFGSMFLFCLLLRTIDWTGKRRVARRIGLLYK